MQWLSMLINKHNQVFANQRAEGSSLLKQLASSCPPTQTCAPCSSRSDCLCIRSWKPAEEFGQNTHHGVRQWVTTSNVRRICMSARCHSSAQPTENQVMGARCASSPESHRKCVPASPLVEATKISSVWELDSWNMWNIFIQKAERHYRKCK